MGALLDRIKQSAAPTEGAIIPNKTGGGLLRRIKEGATKDTPTVEKKSIQSPFFPSGIPQFPIADVKTSTPQTSTSPTPTDMAGDFAKAAGQGIARAWATTGARLAKNAKLAESDVIDPQTIFGTSKFGKSLAENIFGKTEKFNAKSEDIEFLEAFGVDPEVAKGTGGSLTLLLSALDLTGAGGAPKGLAGAIKAIKNVKNTEEAIKLGRSLGLADDIVEQYADIFVKASNAQEAKAALEAASKLNDTTILKSPTTTRTLETEIPVSIPEELRPLAREAQKYSSADDFINAQKPIFRASEKPFDPNLVKEDGYTPGAYFTFDESFAKEYGKGIRPVERLFINKNANILQYEDIPDSLKKVQKLTEETKLESQKIFNFAKENGYDAVISETKAYNGRGDEITIINPEVVKTEPQLIKFYDEVHFVRSPRPQIQMPNGLPKIGVEDLPTQRTTTGRQTKQVIKGAEKKIVKDEPSLLRDKLRSEARGARAGFKAGKAQAREDILTRLRATAEATSEVKDEIVQYVKANLLPEDRGKALVMIRDAKTQKDLTKAFARVNRWAEHAEKIAIRNDILRKQKSILNSPSIAADYKDKIKSLIGEFDLKGRQEKTLERLQKIQRFLSEEAKKGNDVEMPRRILRSLEILNRTPFDEITINQLQGLRAEMDLLENLGRTKYKTIQRIWAAQKTKILDDIAEQGVKPLNKAEAIQPEIGERLTVTAKFKNILTGAMNQMSRIDKVISPMDVVFDLLDGGKGTYDGANFRYFKGQIDAGYSRYITRRDALQAPVFDLIEKYKMNQGNFERIGVVAAREQNGGMEKLIASGFTEDQVNKVTLTTQEREVLDKMRETFDSQFPEIQDTMLRVYNQPVKKVKNYFSFMTDWKSTDELEVFKRFGDQDPEQYGAPRKNVEAGFTKSRVGGDQKIKINALDVFMQHTDNTSYLLELGETTKMLGEVAATDEFARLAGDQGQLLVREYIDVIARKGGAAGAKQIPILDTLRRNVGAGILGLKISTVAIQPTALLDGMGFIGVPHGTTGFANVMSSSKWRKYVFNMPEIRDRLGGEFALRELENDGFLQSLQKKGFVPMQKVDQITAASIAAGAYERKMAELGRVIDFTKDYDAEALAYAQLAVRRTQSSGSFKDVPLAVSRGALTGNQSLDRAMLQFQNFLLNRWSRIRHDALRASINTKDPKKAAAVFSSVIAAAVAGAGIRLGVNRVTDFITGEEDDTSVDEELLRNFIFEVTGNVPFLGTAISMAVYDGEMFPILDAPKSLVSGAQRAMFGTKESTRLKGIAEFSGALGGVLGIPGSTQAEQFARGFINAENQGTTANAQKPKKVKIPSDLPGLPDLPETNLPALPPLPGLPPLP